MAENPDRQLPSAGDLRFVKRAGDPALFEEKGRTLRILQRFEWSNTEKKLDWFDVPLKEE